MMVACWVDCCCLPGQVWGGPGGGVLPGLPQGGTAAAPQQQHEGDAASPAAEQAPTSLSLLHECWCGLACRMIETGACQDAIR